MRARALIDARADNQVSAVGLHSEDYAGVTAADMATGEGNTAAVIGLFRCLPTRRIKRALQHFAKAHVFELMTDRVYFAFAEKILQAKLCRIHTKLLGDHVRMAIDGEGRSHGAGTAVITAGDRVGVNLHELDVGVVDAILSAGIMPGRQRSI